MQYNTIAAPGQPRSPRSQLQRRAVSLDPSTLNTHMFKVAESLHAAYDIMYGAGYFLNEAEVSSLRSNLDRMGRHYQMLACCGGSRRSSFTTSLLTWQTKPPL